MSWDTLYFQGSYIFPSECCCISNININHKRQTKSSYMFKTLMEFVVYMSMKMGMSSTRDFIHPLKLSREWLVQTLQCCISNININHKRQTKSSYMFKTLMEFVVYMSMKMGMSSTRDFIHPLKLSREWLVQTLQWPLYDQSSMNRRWW